MKRRNGDDAMTTHSTRITIENDPRWAAVVARDPRADGKFVYAVKTTGVYCRPSSLARLPNPQNVEFFDTAELAQAAGYRPSKRAAKDQSEIAAQHAATVAAACRQIEEAHQSEEVLATGYSCRSQAKRFANANLRHPVQVLLQHLSQVDAGRTFPEVRHAG